MTPIEIVSLSIAMIAVAWALYRQKIEAVAFGPRKPEAQPKSTGGFVPYKTGRFVDRAVIDGPTGGSASSSSSYYDSSSSSTYPPLFFHSPIL